MLVIPGRQTEAGTRVISLPVLEPYARTSRGLRHGWPWLLVLGAAAFLYGAVFASTGTHYLIQLSVPLIVLAGVVIWLIPETGKAPTRQLEFLFFAFLLALLCWPDYIALALPGMPWITAIRLVGIPLATVFLLALSQSPQFRSKLKSILTTSTGVWQLLVAFFAIALLSIAVSADIRDSINKFVVAILYWGLIFLTACVVFTRPRRIQTFAYLIWFAVIFVCLIGVQEARQQALPWTGRIPSFLQIDDDSVQRFLSPKSRSSTGIYRVQSKFTTPLGLAEFLAYSLPLVLHLAVTAHRNWVRIGAIFTIPLVYYIIDLTDSRLGMVGFFLTFLFYVLLWAGARWAHHRLSLFGPALVLSYPVIFAGFILSTFYVGRLNNLIWGTQAHQFSTTGRELQLAAGLPKILQRPWGYGIGQGGETLGFTNYAGIFTIDNYYLLVGLEYGLFGFLAFFGVFYIAIINAGLSVTRKLKRDTGYIIPLAICLVNFVVIKWVFAQQENHPLIFAVLGAVVALIYRLRGEGSSSFGNGTTNSADLPRS